MNRYRVLKDKHQQEVNAFPLVAAFNNEQFEKAMATLGLTPEDTDKIYKLGDTGCFYRRTDAPALHEMFDRHEKEMQDAIDGDPTGDGFIFEMFDYELGNYEYAYTGDAADAIEALGLSWGDIRASEKLMRGLIKAQKKQKEWYEKHG